MDISTATHAIDEPMARYNVVWNAPSKDASGQMPLGNGDIAAGVYAIEDGDLYLLLAKNDALTHRGDIFKTGRVRVSLRPNPFIKGKPFRQTLDLSTGSILIEFDGGSVRVWADANRPVYHIQVHSLESISVTATPEFWERFTDWDAGSMKAPITNVTQDVRLERGKRILWYNAVGDRSDHADDMKFYDVEGMAPECPDPYRFNTFGNLLECREMELKNGELSGRGKIFDIRIHALAMQTPEIGDWIEAIEKQAAAPMQVDCSWEDHCRWWSTFWNRSWIIASDNSLRPEEREMFEGEAPDGKRAENDGGALVSQSYNVFRFLMACQSRGRIQTNPTAGCSHNRSGMSNSCRTKMRASGVVVSLSRINACSIGLV